MVHHLATEVIPSLHQFTTDTRQIPYYRKCSISSNCLTNIRCNDNDVIEITQGRRLISWLISARDVNTVLHYTAPNQYKVTTKAAIV